MEHAMPDIRIENLIPRCLWQIDGPREEDGERMQYGRITRTLSGRFEAHADDASFPMVPMGEPPATYVVRGPSLGTHGKREDAVGAIVAYARANLGATPDEPASDVRPG